MSVLNRMALGGMYQIVQGQVSYVDLTVGVCVCVSVDIYEGDSIAIAVILFTTIDVRWLGW